MFRTVLPYLLLLPSLLSARIALAQDVELRRVVIDGKVYPVLISGGDTMIIADLKEVTIKSSRIFASKEDERLYYLYRRHAIKVYPYAVEAIRIFRAAENDTQKMSRRQRRKYMSQLQDDLKREFEEPLMNLTRTQGAILVKMIEMEQNRSMYDLLSSVRGPLTAIYWNSISYFYGYRLKWEYKEGDDPILDMVLKDFNISYDVDDPDFKLPDSYRASGSAGQK
jgi:hypothetical protein